MYTYEELLSLRDISQYLKQSDIDFKTKKIKIHISREHVLKIDDCDLTKQKLRLKYSRAHGSQCQINLEIDFKTLNEIEFEVV
jgi:hypothetical protein